MIHNYISQDHKLNSISLSLKIPNSLATST
nr:MAG TPA: hypothetical protein [Caudoviricetes sp.]